MPAALDLRGCLAQPVGAVVDAWVNWNPDPLIHAYGAALGNKANRRFVAMCRVMVREHLGHEFDPDHPRACWSEQGSPGSRSRIALPN